MPKAIPPSSWIVPSEEETKEGLWFLFVVVCVGIIVFGLWTRLYHQDSKMIKLGRSSSISWVTWKAHTFDEQAYRTSENYRIVWLIGSSVLRESFDEEFINSLLHEQHIPIRIAQFGMDRGAAGLSFPLLRILPLRKGDIIVHSVAASDFRKDWLKNTRLPTYQLMSLFSYADFWNISEWSLGEKIEQGVALPYDYWCFHEDFTLGITKAWIASSQLRFPKESKPKYFLKYHKFLSKNKKKILYGTAHQDYFSASENDFSPEQFNMYGLQQMYAIASSNGATVKLVDIQPSKIYYKSVLNQELQEIWTEWKKKNNVWELPPLPVSEYYDLKHPNRIGRQKLNQHLFTWITNVDF